MLGVRSSVFDFRVRAVAGSPRDVVRQTYVVAQTPGSVHVIMRCVELESVFVGNPEAAPPMDASLPIVNLNDDAEKTASVEESVRRRYAQAAQAVEPSLCCPVDYDPGFLRALPAEILERDYGCGDPSRYVRPGETVLDLGSGGGKICYIAAQVVGPSGRVIGIDCNAEMLALARKYQREMAEKLGYANVEFRCGMIQDLRLDLDRLAEHLERAPIRDAQDWLRLRQIEQQLRDESPLIADASIDCVVSNCVLNLVRPSDRRQLLSEVFRVLKPGGRAAISDIVCDRDVPLELQRDPELWSGCLSGAFREDEFLRAFEGAGFHGIRIAKREAQPWRVVAGIEFRAVTVLAYKGGVAAPSGEGSAVIYLGPFQAVEDDAGQRYERGKRTPVGAETRERLRREPYADQFASLDASDREDGCCDHSGSCC